MSLFLLVTQCHAWKMKAWWIWMNVGLGKTRQTGLVKWISASTYRDWNRHMLLTSGNAEAFTVEPLINTVIFLQNIHKRYSVWSVKISYDPFGLFEWCHLISEILLKSAISQENMSDYVVNSSLPGQNGCYFADGIFKCIFLNEKV